jgi:hypothetical protein
VPIRDSNSDLTYSKRAAIYATPHVHTAGCGNGYHLQVHHVYTAVGGKEYTLHDHVHIAGCGKGYALHNSKSILLFVQMDRPCTSILLVLVVVKGIPSAHPTAGSGKQCWGSVTLRCRSGSGSPDPNLWLMDPDLDPTPDPTFFFIDFKDKKKSCFFL